MASEWLKRLLRLSVLVFSFDSERDSNDIKGLPEELAIAFPSESEYSETLLYTFASNRAT